MMLHVRFYAVNEALVLSVLAGRADRRSERNPAETHFQRTCSDWQQQRPWTSAWSSRTEDRHHAEGGMWNNSQVKNTAANHCPPLSPLEKSLNNAVICLWEEQGDERTNTHRKISLFTHKYQTQRQMRKSLVYVSKAFDHATFSTLKKKNTKNLEHSLVHQRHNTMSNIYTIQ